MRYDTSSSSPPRQNTHRRVPVSIYDLGGSPTGIRRGGGLFHKEPAMMETPNKAMRAFARDYYGAKEQAK